MTVMKTADAMTFLRRKRRTREREKSGKQAHMEPAAGAIRSDCSLGVYMKPCSSYGRLRRNDLAGKHNAPTCFHHYHRRRRHGHDHQRPQSSLPYITHVATTAATSPSFLGSFYGPFPVAPPPTTLDGNVRRAHRVVDAGGGRRRAPGPSASENTLDSTVWRHFDALMWVLLHCESP